MSQIEIKCLGATTLSLSEMRPLQGALKSLSKTAERKLRRNLERYGYSFPIAVWENPKDRLFYILDGHQRHAVLTKMKAEGVKVPQLPVVIVEADTLREAKQKLLGAASRFGLVDESELRAFVSDAAFEEDLESLLASIEFPEADLAAMLADTEEVRELARAGSEPEPVARVPDPDEPEDDLGPSEDGPEPDEPEASESESVSLKPSGLKTLVLYFEAEDFKDFQNKVGFLQLKKEKASVAETLRELVVEAFNSFAK